jgi:cytoskeletal protein RodZ
MDQSEDSSQLKPLGLSVADAMVIGKKLSNAREQRRISVTELARKVKIREHFASAIERGDWASLPPGLNGRGLVRIYARELGVGVPELEPSAHLTAVNAKFERAEQQNTEDVLRAQTIRSYRADEAQPRNPRPKPTGRTVEPQRSSPGSSGLPRPVKSSAAPPTPSFVPQKESGSSKRFESSDEESPLDVLTPDIAAVLGLNLDGSDVRDAGDANSSADALRRSDENLIPTVNVDDILGTEIGHTHSEHSHIRPPAPISFNNLDSRADSVDQDSSIPVVSAFPSMEQFEERVTLPEPSILPTTVPIPQSPYREQPNSAVASYLEQIARTHPESMMRGETLADGLTAASETESGSGSIARQRRSMGFRLAVIGAIVVAAAGIGIGFFLIPSSPREPDLHIKEIGSDAPPATDSGSLPNMDATSPAEAANTEAQQPDAATASGATGAAQSPEAGAAQRPEAGTAQRPEAGTAQKSETGLVEVVQGSGSSQSAPLAAAPAPAAAPAETAPAAAPAETAPSVAPAAAAAPLTPADPNQRTIGSGTSIAKLVVSEPVDIQIRVDDGVVLDGRQSAGPIQVLFSKKAEIVVQDGSKVELTYGDWVHGPLGQKGRKRRIILNAARFRAEPTAQTSP